MPSRCTTARRRRARPALSVYEQLTAPAGRSRRPDRPLRHAAEGRSEAGGGDPRHGGRPGGPRPWCAASSCHRTQRAHVLAVFPADRQARPGRHRPRRRRQEGIAGVARSCARTDGLRDRRDSALRLQRRPLAAGGRNARHPLRGNRLQRGQAGCVHPHARARLPGAGAAPTAAFTRDSGACARRRAAA